MWETLITADDFEHAREQSDDIWDDYDVFYEERDEYPLRELVLQVVEGLFTHPSGTHNMQDLSDSVDGLVHDYVNDVVPEEIPDETTDKFRRKVSDTVHDHSEELYKATREKADGMDTISEIQSYLEEKADEVGVPETA